jgi:hypothetical protein
VTASTTVAVLEGVAPGWTLLDNFDRYQAGPANAPGYWVDARGNSSQYVDYKGNLALKTTTGDSVIYLPLRNLSLKEGEIGTLFFRMITSTNNGTNMVALTDKGQRGYGDAVQNIGPAVYAQAFTNDVWGIDTNAWYLGARNGFFGGNVSSDIDFGDSVRALPPEPLTFDTVYNVWIEVTNAPMAERASDVFSVYIQKNGEAARTLRFQNYLSDRDFDYSEAVLGGMFPTLDKLLVIGNNANFSALFDDFYLAKGAYSATVPRAYEFTGSAAPSALQIGKSGDQIQIQWTSGVLQESSNLSTWTDVPGATPPSYTVTPSGNARFYRAR